jgi:hypothetical protein
MVHAKLVDRVSPLFCHNHVVHHKPYVFKKQFGFHEVDIDVNAFNFVDYEIKLKDNRGQFPHDYFKIYEKELKIWNDCICFEHTCPMDEPRLSQPASDTHTSSQQQSSVDAEVDLEVEHTYPVDEPRLSQPASDTHTSSQQQSSPTQTTNRRKKKRRHGATPPEKLEEGKRTREAD